MSIISVKWAELHSALFHGGKNFGLKLDPKRAGGLKLDYDTEERELLVTWAGETMHLPYSSVQCYLPGDVEQPQAAIVKPVPVAKMQAQVDGPTSHVHKGPGFGRTGK